MTQQGPAEQGPAEQGPTEQGPTEPTPAGDSAAVEDGGAAEDGGAVEDRRRHAERVRRLRAALDLDLVPDQTDDERGSSWGERPGTPDADLRHFREQKPPHHGP